MRNFFVGEIEYLIVKLKFILCLETTYLTPTTPNHFPPPVLGGGQGGGEPTAKPVKKDQINNIPQLKENRRQLRKNSTPAEAVLWEALRGSRLHGRKFRRQHSVGPYILDFYCSAEKLAVEVDGDDHFTADGAANDVERTAFLQTHQIRVVRFANEEVIQHVDEVLEKISRCFTSPPCPPPVLGGGQGEVKNQP